MFRWLNRLISRAPVKPSRDALLNEGLELAMDWGENWLAPIQERLHKRHPHLDRDELDDVNTTVQAAMRLGQETAFKLATSAAGPTAEQEFRSAIAANVPWINAENLERLFKHSMYFAWKTGGPAREAAR